MAEKHTLRVTVITPERTALDAQALSVVFPACDGEWGVLPGHADLIAMLGCGVLRYTRPDESLAYLAVRGGFAQVKEDVIAILTPESAAPENLNAAALDAETAQLAEPPAEPAEREAHAQKVQWLRARRKAAAFARSPIERY